MNLLQKLLDRSGLSIIFKPRIDDEEELLQLSPADQDGFEQFFNSLLNAVQ
jgi:hypothetical protein